MKTLKFKITIILLFFLCNTSVFGQDNKNDNQQNSYFSAAMNYISDAVFMGRKDSISAPYLYSSLGYHHKSGFYTKGSISYLTKSNESRIDLYLLTVGIDFNVKNLYGDISATKYFFNTDSYTVISEVEADITASLLYDFKIINLSLTASSYFSKNSNSDFFLSSEISHDFIGSNNKFQISPTAGIHLGSQNFYEEYYISRQIRINQGGSGSGSGGSGGTTQTVTDVVVKESENFDIMAIEFSLPMWYTDKSFTISFLPSLVIPKNEATLTIDEEVFKEELDETFYWMVGVSYKF